MGRLRVGMAAAASFAIACNTIPLVPGVDGSLGVSAPQAFYYDHPAVPYVVYVSNLGDTDGAAPVEVHLQVSQGVTLASHQPASWSCGGTAPLFVCVWNDPLPSDSSLPDLELDLDIGPFDVVKDSVRICTELRVKDDVDPNNNQVCEEYPVHFLDADYDFQVTTTLWTVGSVGPNELTYTALAENLGPDVNWNDVWTLDVDVPAGVNLVQFNGGSGLTCGSADPLSIGCEGGLIGSGFNNWRSLWFKLDVPPGFSGDITVCAQVSAPQDLNPTNDESCTSLTWGVPDPFDLQVTAEVLNLPAPGLTGQYRWTLHNAGPNPTTEQLVVTIDAPPLQSTLSYFSGIDGSIVPSTNIGQCTQVGSQLECPVSLVFAAGESRFFWMTFFADPGATSTFPACLSIDPNGDTVAANNSACLSIGDPAPIGDFGITAKLSPVGEYRQGEIGSFTFVATHTGAARAPDPVLAFLTLPPALSFVGVGGTEAFDCVSTLSAIGDELVTCIHNGSLAPGAAETLAVAVYANSAGEADVCSEISPKVDGMLPSQTQSCATVSIQPAP